MRRSETQSIGLVLGQYVEALKMRRKLKEVSVVKHWNTIMAKGIINYTTQVYIKSGVLYVHVSSSVVRNELTLNQQKIIERLNKCMGEEIVMKIVFR